MRLTDSEWQIMNALWDDHPATARELSERLPDEVQWAYTTLKTMLSRLVKKGAVSERKRGNTSVYEPVTTRDRARRTAVTSLLERAFGGAAEPLLHFLASDRALSDGQKRRLAEILDAEESRGEDGA